MPMHEDQLHITSDMVHRLVRAQFPLWANEPVCELQTEGSSNAIFRMGSGLSARFPLRMRSPQQALNSIVAERAAQRELAQVTTTRIPQTLSIGAPGFGFPLPWSIQTWLPGETATQVDVGGSMQFARDVAAFVLQLRSTPTQGRTFGGRGRGGDLAVHDPWMEECFAKSEELLEIESLRELWMNYRSLQEHPVETMTHGDLIGGNLLVAKGRLVGVLDHNSYGAADPSVDLVVAWHILDTGPRSVFREELRCTPLEWERGKAWAFQQAMGLVWYYETTNLPLSQMGRRTLARLTAADGNR